MSKVNVYVPDELRERMNAYPDVNWSDVAQRAFEHAMGCNCPVRYITERIAIHADWCRTAHKDGR